MVPRWPSTCFPRPQSISPALISLPSSETLKTEQPRSTRLTRESSMKELWHLHHSDGSMCLIGKDHQLSSVAISYLRKSWWICLIFKQGIINRIIEKNDRKAQKNLNPKILNPQAERRNQLHPQKLRQATPTLRLRAGPSQQHGSPAIQKNSIIARPNASGLAMALRGEVLDSPLPVRWTLGPGHDIQEYRCVGVRRGPGGFHVKDEEAHTARSDVPSDQGHWRLLQDLGEIQECQRGWVDHRSGLQRQLLGLAQQLSRKEPLLGLQNGYTSLNNQIYNFFDWVEEWTSLWGVNVQIDG